MAAGTFQKMIRRPKTASAEIRSAHAGSNPGPACDKTGSKTRPAKKKGE